MKMLLMAFLLVFVYACANDGLNVDLKALAANTEMTAPQKSLKLMDAFTQIMSKTASIEDNAEAAKYLNGVIDTHEGDIRKISEDFITWNTTASAEDINKYTQEIESMPFFATLDSVLGTLGRRMQESEELQSSMMRFMQVTNPQPEETSMPSEAMPKLDSVETAPQAETPQP